MDCQNNHQHEERHHEILGHPFQAALQIKAQHNKAKNNSNCQIAYVDRRVRDHCNEAEICALSEKEHHEIVHHPARNDRIERHQSNIAEKCNVSVDMPLMTGFFQFLIHFHRACLGSSAHCKLHDHCRQAEENQAQNIHEYKTTAAELAGHPRELPNIAAANCAPRAQQDESQTAAEFFTSVIHNYLL